MCRWLLRLRPTCCNPCQTDQNCCKKTDGLSGWYVTAEALFLRRTNGNANFPMVIDSTTGGTVMSTRDLSFNTGVGPRLLIGYGWDNETAVEASYFGLINNNATSTVTGNNNLALPNGLGLASFDFFNANRMQASYRLALEQRRIQRGPQLWLLFLVEWISLLSLERTARHQRSRRQFRQQRLHDHDAQ